MQELSTVWSLEENLRALKLAKDNNRSFGLVRTLEIAVEFDIERVKLAVMRHWARFTRLDEETAAAHDSYISEADERVGERPYND